MKVFGLDISVIVIALVTAYIGYQFNFRTKKKENFIKELTNSYNEVYFPMNEMLQEIVCTEDKNKKHKLIENFINKFSGPNSQIRFIGSSFILEYFYELRSYSCNELICGLKRKSASCMLGLGMVHIHCPN